MSENRKILIISYYFRPSNFVGSQRINAFADYFNENGFYPIIVTRCWNHNQCDETNKVKKNEIIHEKHESHEVFYTPVKKWIMIDSNSPLKFFRRLFIFFEMFLSPFNLKFLHYYNFYVISKKIIRENKDLDVIMVSSKPYSLFQIAYQLSKINREIKIIADYRDEWTTHPNRPVEGVLSKLKFKMDIYFEKKWSKCFHFFTSVSEESVQNIKKLINKEGFTIYNGFESKDILFDKESSNLKANNNIFMFTYLGTVYPSQDFLPIIKVFNRLMVDFPNQIRVRFVGLSNSLEEVRELKKIIGDSLINYDFIPRKPHNKIKEILLSSDALFLTPYKGVNHWLPVKLFDYAVANQPILIYPSDNGSIHHFIESSNLGLLSNYESEESILKQLKYVVSSKLSGHRNEVSPNWEFLNYYSRKNQVNTLSNLLK